MTMISPRRRRKPLALITYVFLALFFIVLIVVAIWRTPISALVWQVASPLLYTRSQGANIFTALGSQFQDKATLAQENTRLRAELAEKDAALLDRDLLLKENIQLKSRLGRIVGDTPVVLAAVLMRPPGLPYDTLVIDIGANKNVAVGDLVAAGGSAYMGTIAQVYDTTARVILFSSPGIKQQAVLGGTVSLEITGQGAGSLVGEVPIGTLVRVGDPVVLPAITPQIFARVAAVVHREGESFQRLYFTLPASPFSIQTVEVHPHSL